MLSSKKTVQDLKIENGDDERGEVSPGGFEMKRWLNSYMLSEESLKRLSSEAYNMMKTSKDGGDSTGNVERISLALRKAELFYLGLKTWAADIMRYSPQVDKVLSKTMIPSECIRDGDTIIMVFPFMFPHRMDHHKTRIYAYEVKDALTRLDLSSWNKKRKYCVAFIHEYAKDFDMEKLRDNDNTEEKWAIDAMVGTLFSDDGALNIDIFHTSRLAEFTDTLVVVCPASNLSIGLEKANRLYRTGIRN